MEVIIIESRAYQELVSRIEDITAYVQRQTQADEEKDEKSYRTVTYDTRSNHVPRYQ